VVNVTDEDADVPAEAMIPKYQLQDLCSEAAKLKTLGAMESVPPDRLVRLLNILEKNIRDGTRVSPIADPVSVLGWGVILYSGVPRGGGLGCPNTPPPPRNSEGPPKSCQTQPDCENLKIAEFRMPTLRDVQIKGSKILKLPLVHNCFTLAMTNKLVVVINSLKVPKIKKLLLSGAFKFS